MVELDNIRIELNSYKTPLEEIEAALDLDAKRQKVEELERKMEEPNFWDNAEAAQLQTKELSDLKTSIKTVED